MLELAERAGALVLGPGIGRAEGALEWAREVARRAPVPVLIDADGLNAHAEPARVAARAARRRPILTPHDGRARAAARHRVERGRRPQRLACAREAAERSGCDGGPQGRRHDRGALRTARCAVSRGATPALATAGTGDVLSGLGGHAARAREWSRSRQPPRGVLAHARAGQVAAGRDRRRIDVIAG